MDNIMKSLSNEHLNYDGTFLNGKQLAEFLGVAPPTLSEAVKYGYNCSGHPVEEWVQRSESGRVKGYYVPKAILKEEHPESKMRENPETEPLEEVPENQANETDVIPNSEPAKQTVTHNNYSLLPEGEDYVKPVGMAALSSTLTKAVEEDTPQSRAVIVSTLTILGAITGNAITADVRGAALGGGAGLAIALFSYLSFDQNEYAALQDLPLQGGNQAVSESTYQTETLPQLEINVL